MKKIEVGFYDERVKKEYEKAREQNPQLFKFLERATDDLKQDPCCGIQIPHDYWPKNYKGLDSLWKYNLPNDWRLIYTIKADKVQILAILLQWCDHIDYAKLFGYKT